MKRRIYTQGMTFFVTPEMYQAIINIADEKRISISELVRDFISHHLVSESISNQGTKETSDGE